ncbi:DNA primase [Saccharopolyspora antimicrobica]|uniref:DNA primase n=1 Tax=Saccharopolyspora antimicrobica TaxID=455193 RepID=A0A1I4YNJ7_9PSEU|nr:DNA primase [Saccharopolyspora antimicrobica]RKT82752.1 DNA primase [Saccharopolyspora antimicrobica]SFN39591.1 DNA primase [Saccharopolyspora antimicrobica]
MAGRIRESDIAEVRDRIRIDDVVGEYVALRSAGGGAQKGLCPFHDEKTPSFNVRPSHGTFHCFGCGEGGDVIAFLMKIEHLGFVESVERLADQAGIQLQYEGGAPGPKRDRGTRARMVEAHRIAAEFYAEQLRSPEALKAREYLAERGFDEAAAQRFGCGFAPAGWDKLTKILLQKGFELDELIKCGLSKEGRRGPIDRFHRRLLWPLKDLGGDVVGFGARRLFDDDPIQAKYVNTSATPIFNKSQVLFGIDLAKREIAKRRQAVVVEGYTDVMAMHLAGVPTAVASCGTAFGDEHIAVLRRLMLDDDVFRGEVIFTFDGDEAGKKAALKAFEGEQQFTSQTFVAITPDGMDPCELREAKGDAAVRDLVARRRPLFEFAIRSLLNEHDLTTVEGRVAALKRTIPLVQQIKDQSSKENYAVQLAGWSGWHSENDVVRRVKGGSGRQARPVRKQAPKNQVALGIDVDLPRRPPRNDPRLLVEREALKAALQLPALAGPTYDALPEDAFTERAYAELHRAILLAGGTASGLDGASLVGAVAQQCGNEVVARLLTELVAEPLDVQSDDGPRYVADLITRMQERLVSRQIADIKSNVQRISPVEDAEEYNALFGDLIALEGYRKALLDKIMGTM